MCVSGATAGACSDVEVGRAKVGPLGRSQQKEKTPVDASRTKGGAWERRHSEWTPSKKGNKKAMELGEKTKYETSNECQNERKWEICIHGEGGWAGEKKGSEEGKHGGIGGKGGVFWRLFLRRGGGELKKPKASLEEGEPKKTNPREGRIKWGLGQVSLGKRTIVEERGVIDEWGQIGWGDRKAEGAKGSSSDIKLGGKKQLFQCRGLGVHQQGSYHVVSQFKGVRVRQNKIIKKIGRGT